MITAKTAGEVATNPVWTDSERELLHLIEAGDTADLWTDERGGWRVYAHAHDERPEDTAAIMMHVAADGMTNFAAGERGPDDGYPID